MFCSFLDPPLKDGTNIDNIQRSLEKNVELESKENLVQTKTASPFNDLYQMIKESLDVKTPRKFSSSLLQTPTSRFYTPKPASVAKNGKNLAMSSEDGQTPKKDETEVSSGATEMKMSNRTPKWKQSAQALSSETAGSDAVKGEVASPQRRNRTPPQRFTVGEVIEQVSAQSPKSPMRRRSKEATPTKPTVTKNLEKEAVNKKTEGPRKASPRNSGKVETGDKYFTTNLFVY